MLLRPILSLLTVATATLLGLLASQQNQPSVPGVRGEQDEAAWASKPPELVIGYENCRKCHQQQIEKLVTTNHFKSYESLHRSPAAKAICKALGIRSVKRSERCVRCHFTPEVTKRGIRAQSGISCESCHGPAKNWVQGHNDYGGLEITRETETSQHRQWRIATSIERGMRHPQNLYLLAKSCYDCHMVDDAELVNQTAHPAASLKFDMVSWSQGSMRHNYLRTGGTSNALSNPERLRVMLVTDVMTRLQYLLQGLAPSRPGTKYHSALAQDLAKTTQRLKQFREASDNRWITEAVRAVGLLSAQSTSTEQRQIAKALGKIAFDFASQAELHNLESLDPFLPQPEQYR